MLREFSNKKFVCKIYRCLSHLTCDGLQIWDEQIVDTRISSMCDGDDITLAEAHRYFCSIVRDHRHPHGYYRVSTSLTRCDVSLASYIRL